MTNSDREEIFQLVTFAVIVGTSIKGGTGMTPATRAKKATEEITALFNEILGLKEHMCEVDKNA